MQASHSYIILGSIALYLIFCLGVGLWSYGRTKSSKDFFAAGRDIGVIVSAFAVFSCVLSGFGFVVHWPRPTTPEYEGLADKKTSCLGVIKHLADQSNFVEWQVDRM